MFLKVEAFGRFGCRRNNRLDQAKKGDQGGQNTEAQGFILG